MGKSVDGFRVFNNTSETIEFWVQWKDGSSHREPVDSQTRGLINMGGVDPAPETGKHIWAVAEDSSGASDRSGKSRNMEFKISSGREAKFEAKISKGQFRLSFEGYKTA